MNTFLFSALCLLGAWAALAGAVTVQDGDLSFPLESVKKLKDLREIPGPKDHHGRKAEAPHLCSNPEFPKELQAICGKPNANDILLRLEAIAQDPSICEICAFAACTGC